MNIKTVSIILPDGRLKDDSFSVTFNVKKNEITNSDTALITGGSVFEILKEKYLKPEMIQW
jgi:hypothetical protein